MSIIAGTPLAEFLTEVGPGPWHYIYGLHDPRTMDLRYIGKSDRPVERLMNQMNERANTHRCHWLGELRAAGLRPVQFIIDATPFGTDWQPIECAYIAAARAMGCRLTNGTDGGDGVPGLGPESLARMRTAWLGRKHRPESRTKMSAANMGRKHTDEYREMMRQIMSVREFTETHRQRIREGVQKLTSDQVREIRVALAAGERQRDIGARFGVHQGTISDLARGRTYQHIPREDPS